MAADVITRFKLETTQFDSKLRDAAKSLQEIAHQAELGGKDFNNFSKKAIDAARSLGTIKSGANNTKDKLKDLVGSFNDAAKAYNSLSETAKKGEFGQALSASLQKLQQDIKQTKEELYSLNNSSNGKGGDLGGSMTMASFKGNVYAYAAEKGAEALNMLKDKITDVLKESMKMSMEAEGIRIAYERLGRPDLMDKLKEATHGTVTELELMKQAVKFNDFRLSLDDMGAMLAFAQQKAKDTGQSIDFMVDSIVTGLGRQSKQILDNLGISAAEIGEKMKTSGDMTKAVAEIIREQMAKSGDYIETSMDRAAKAAVAVRDEMLTLGDQMRETFGTGSIEELSSMLELRLIKDLESLVDTVGDLSTGFGILGTDAGKSLKAIADVAYVVVREILMWETGLFEIVRLISAISGDSDKKVGSIAKNIQSVATGYANAYGNANVLPEFVVTGKKGGGRSGGGSKSGTDRIAFDPNKAALAVVKADETATGSSLWQSLTQNVSYLNDEISESGDSFKNLTKWTDKFDPTKTGKKNNPFLHYDDDGKATVKLNEIMGGISSGIGQMVSGIEALGVEIPEGIKKALNAMQGISSILTGIATTVLAIEAITGADAIIPFARGGMIKAFSGTLVGTTYSGDQLRGIDQSGQLYGLNAGEVVLNRAQVGNLASQLNGSGLQNLHLEAVVEGEQIHLVQNRFLRRSGRGELVTWK